MLQYVIPAKSAYGGHEPGSSNKETILESLDSGYSLSANSGMTGLANCDIVSKGRRDAAELINSRFQNTVNAAWQVIMSTLHD